MTPNASGILLPDEDDDIQLIGASAAQQRFMASMAPRKTGRMGRGFGKSRILGWEAIEMIEELPGCKIGLAGLSFAHLKNKTMPSFRASIRSCGYQPYDPAYPEYGHYVAFKKPPSDWPKPFEEPFKFDNIISFRNGSCVELFSLDRADTGRGANLDGLLLDESALIDEDDFENVLLPMVRANRFIFEGNPFHHRVIDVTSTPWLPSGQWIYKTEDLMAVDPAEYFYMEGTAWDNVHVLGEKYIERLRQKMSPQRYRVELMNERVNRATNSFYPSFNEATHCKRTPYDYDFDDENYEHIVKDRTIDVTKPVDLSFDFNGAIVTLVQGQQQGQVYKLVNCLFAMDDEEGEATQRKHLVRAAVDVFVKANENHLNKRVTIYGDVGGNRKTETNPLTAYQEIEIGLRAKGWAVQLEVASRYPDHVAKQLLIDKLFREESPSTPRIRFDNDKCKYLIISMQAAGLKADGTKDKSSERNLSDQRRATHASDALDYLLYAKFAHMVGLVIVGESMVIRGRR